MKLMSWEPSFKHNAIFHFNGPLFFSGSKILGEKDFLMKCFDFLSENYPEYTSYVIVDANSRSLMPKNMLVRSLIFPNAQNKVQPVFFFSE